MVTFNMLIGLPGSGKGYIANSLSKNLDSAIIISSDKIREELYGDESIQGNPSEVFHIMLKRTREYLCQGISVIYDATNVTRKHRISLISQLPKNISKYCYIVWARYETCILRDEERIRHVGKDVILKMLKRFQCPHKNEGWNDINIIFNDIDGYNYSQLNLNIPHDNPHHPNTVSEHIHQVRRFITDDDTIDNSIRDILLNIARYHDIGKPLCKTFVNTKGETTDIAHYYDHQNVSAYLTLGMNELKKLSDEDKLKLTWLVNMHMDPFFSESNYWKNNIGEEDKSLILLFNQFDREGA